VLEDALCRASFAGPYAPVDKDLTEVRPGEEANVCAAAIGNQLGRILTTWPTAVACRNEPLLCAMGGAHTRAPPREVSLAYRMSWTVSLTSVGACSGTTRTWPWAVL
jgi:hypothetical protein